MNSIIVLLYLICLPIPPQSFHDWWLNLQGAIMLLQFISYYHYIHISLIFLGEMFIIYYYFNFIHYLFSNPFPFSLFLYVYKISLYFFPVDLIQGQCQITVFGLCLKVSIMFLDICYIQVISTIPMWSEC